MKKLFTIVCAALLSAGMWADTAILSWNIGDNGTEAVLDSTTGIIVGGVNSTAEGWTLSMDGVADGKYISPAPTDMVIGELTFTPLKNSNGKQVTVTLPEGLYASNVDFYVVTNDESTNAVLKEFAGDACNDVVESLKDFENPTLISKPIETPLNAFTFTFKNKQVAFVAFVTYSNEAPEEPKPTAILSWQLGVDGAEATEANSITGAAGSEAEGWTIAMTGNAEKNWGAGKKLIYKGNEYKTLKNSNGVLITVTLPEGLEAIKVDFYAVTNDAATKGTLKEFDGEACKDSVESLLDYDNPTHITKELAQPKNEFTFLFGGKQVCFLAAVQYQEADPKQAVETVATEKKAKKVIENGQIVIINNGIRYNALGVKQ